MEQLFGGLFDGAFVTTSDRSNLFVVNVVDYAFRELLRHYQGARYIRSPSDDKLYWEFSQWEPY